MRAASSPAIVRLNEKRMVDLVRRAWARLGATVERMRPSGLAPLMLAIALFASGGAFAREVTIASVPADRYLRLLLQFDQATTVDAKLTNSVLVIKFANPTRIKSEKLATELSRYVTAVRRDPDDTGLRVALSTPMKLNVLVAAEKVFIDLLPANWQGVLPGLPPDVVLALSERLRVAEEKAKTEKPARPTFPPVKVRLARLPTLTRVTFESPAGLASRVANKGGSVEVSFDGDTRLDAGQDEPKAAPGVRGFEVAKTPLGLTVKIAAAAGYEAHGFEDDGTFVVDLTKPGPPKAAGPAAAATPDPHAGADPHASAAEHKPDAQKPTEAKAAAAPAVPAAHGPAESPAAVVHGEPGPAADRHEEAAVAAHGAAAHGAGDAGHAGPLPPPRRDGAAPAEPAPASAVLATRGEAEAGRLSLVFPFRARTAAAAYVRSGMLTLVFATADRVDFGLLATQASSVMSLRDAVAADGYLVVRFNKVTASPIRLVQDGNDWRLTVGDAATLAPDALNVMRTLDANGHSVVTASLTNASEVHWMSEPDGRRVAVVPAFGRPQALPLARNFVEFNLPTTIQGVLVEALSDDLTVALGQAGVIVTRDSGLSLSAIGRVNADGSSIAQVSGLVIARDAWIMDGSGNVLTRYREMLAAASNASRAGKGEARYRLARFLLAIGFDREAASVMGLARAEDPVFALRHDPVLLTAIAAAQSGRFGATRTLLSTTDFIDDPESILWRAVADASERRWKSAMLGFRRVTDVVEAYPDDLAAGIRLLVMQSAIEQNDVRRAEAELAAIDRLSIGSIPPDEHDLARARVDEAAGRTDAALKGYDAVIQNGRDRPRAEGILRYVSLAFQTKAIELPAAIDRLETLLAIWRGGDIEIGTTVELARLYSRAKRWREMLAMTRRADKYFPLHELTRALHDESARLFENLLLGDGEALSPVQALALFFDFREFAPAGRRGDQLVRRLADRLVELDLLDQAADLLQYQIDNRLTGVARSTVAARLAAIRLMNGKPIKALEALHGSRLADLPSDIREFRLLIEARAQADLSRTDLALELTEGASGEDFSRLRTGILWSARRWREAGESAEGLLGTKWSEPQPLTDRDRGDVVQAAVAYVLADERLAIDRLRQKFSAKMLDSPSAKTFATLMEPRVGQSREFRAIAQEASRSNALKEVMTDWRLHHPDPMAEGRPAAAGAAGASTTDAAAAADGAAAADDAKSPPQADAAPAHTSG